MVIDIKLKIKIKKNIFTIVLKYTLLSVLYVLGAFFWLLSVDSPKEKERKVTDTPYKS